MQVIQWGGYASQSNDRQADNGHDKHQRRQAERHRPAAAIDVRSTGPNVLRMKATRKTNSVKPIRLITPKKQPSLRKNGLWRISSPWGRPGLVLGPPGRTVHEVARSGVASAVGEFVAHAIHGEDIARIGRVRLDFMADILDVRVDGAFVQTRTPPRAPHPATGRA